MTNVVSNDINGVASKYPLSTVPSLCSEVEKREAKVRQQSFHVNRVLPLIVIIPFYFLQLHTRQRIMHMMMYWDTASPIALSSTLFCAFLMLRLWISDKYMSHPIGPLETELFSNPQDLPEISWHSISNGTTHLSPHGTDFGCHSWFSAILTRKYSVAPMFRPHVWCYNSVQ